MTLSIVVSYARECLDYETVLYGERNVENYIYSGELMRFNGMSAQEIRDDFFRYLARLSA